MPLDNLLLPAWISFLVGLVLFFTRKWVADVARAIDSLDARMREYEQQQAQCRLELARGYPTRAEFERVAERLDAQATRITIIEQRHYPA